MTSLKIGDLAPDFLLPTMINNEPLKLSNLRGGFVLLYFYPKDDTPGCTIEAKAFNDLKPEFHKLNTIIIGVSKDSLASHAKFKEKYCLNFDLISDTDSNICESYGVWTQKSMYGRQYMGIERSTFLIDEKGKIAYIWSKVSVSDHATEVLDIIKGMI